MPDSDLESLLSKIPQVDQLLKATEIADATKDLPRKLVVESIRKYVSVLREKIIKEKRFISQTPADIAEQITSYIKKATKPAFSRVVNATGIIIHTNLGRSPLSQTALSALSEAAKSYCLLEVDPATGERTSRLKSIEPLICRITGAESAIVVNNDAAAVMLTLNALAHNREVICSHGEMVEIGGSFRLPEIVEASGVRLVGVGTTNKTYLSDYEKAVTDQTSALLKVHPSNFEIIGYASSVSISALSALGQVFKIPVVYDIGSGALTELYGEPTVPQALEEGADIVAFSADKLIGGPQAGIIAGAKKYIDIIRKHPLARAVRVGKLTLIALEATLKIYLDSAWAAEEIPILKMILTPEEELKRKANRFIRLAAKEKIPVKTEIVKCESQIGGGTTAGRILPSWGVAVSGKIGSSDLSQQLRTADPHIFSIVREEGVIFDMRTLCFDDDKIIIKKLSEILRD
ncbi:MAG: L-seryl-tRNA(Sec) selenium transferase [Planctomycetota bacterium]